MPFIGLAPVRLLRPNMAVFVPHEWKAAKGLSRAVQPIGTSSMIVVMLAREKRET